MKRHLFSLLVVALYLNKQTVLGTSGLNLPNERVTGLGCIPEGRNVSYECTVSDTGVGSTIWEGSAFNCPTSDPTTSNSISLLHSSFSIGTMRTCGSTLSARSVSFTPGMSYTSQLTFTATPELNGTTIECSVSRVTDVGNDTIRVGAMPPPPGPVTVNFSSDSSFTVSWMPASGTGGYMYMFGVTGVGCGCVSMNTSGTSVTCSGWTAAGQTCSFEVRTLSEDCGFTSDPVTGNVSLTAPSTPTGLSVTPFYSVDGSIQYIDVEFVGVDPPVIGGGVDPSVTYTVMIGSLRFTGVTCNTTNHCTLRVTGSQLATVQSLFTVSVLVSNAVSSGPPTDPSAQVPPNVIEADIVRIQINSLSSTVSCTLLDSFPESPNFICSITFGPLQNGSICEATTTRSSTPTTGRPGVVATISLGTLNPAIVYCYTISMNSDNTNFILPFFTGEFSSICNPSELGTSPTSINGSGSVTVPNGVVSYTGVKTGSTAQLTCDSGYEPAPGVGDRMCTGDGSWSGGNQSCVAVPWWIAIIIVVIIVCFITFGIISVKCCKQFIKGLQQGKSCYILLVVLLIFAFGFGVGVLIGYCCFGRKKTGKEDKVKLGREESHESKQAPDVLYADPNSIEHQTTAGGDEYAMIDVKKKKKKPTQEAALYQDPNTIEHETAPSGETYAVVDKPKRGSKKTEPDVVPPQGAEGLNYADIDVAASRRKPKPAPQHQAQDPGRVEYSIVGQEQAQL